MVRVFSLSLLALLAGSAFANTQEVILDDPVYTLDSWEYTNCGNSDDVIQLESLSVSPDPPKPGQELTITAVGVALKPIKEGASADVVVKLGLIKLLQKTFDVCEEARTANASVQCPVEEGRYTVVQSVVLPKEIPRAKFTVSVRAYTADEEDMLCLDLAVNFLPQFPRPPFLGIW
ncbi:hypothetical protein SCLCIDRAFT_1210755 [Scleroderma citrinum Foug A]|uniref:Phosphatidylglycerol/phosphatidylinositol transfer protein n=1 Tax=Scleroderma citrinum Foug A TaxID=1036808 RepID=A0A0C3E373_9AGAM|nr:hypothetical protein SCLCIDRAFT_1210755 [Scleroderma citrinum Foug A]